MNFHNDEWIMECVREHYNDALEHFKEDRIVCLALQGSQNYGLDMEGSDIDTKLIVAPSFHDIAMNKQPVSTTHVRANNEHIDFKDVRLYIQTFRKANINFMEILFSPYTIINPLYAKEWNRLVKAREDIARYNLPQSIHAMRGTMYTKYKKITNESDIRADAINKFGYSPKEFYQLLRTEEFVTRYIAGEPYEDCLRSKHDVFLKSVKNGHFTAEDAMQMASVSLDTTNKMCDQFLETCDSEVNQEVGQLLDGVQRNIMKIAMRKELESDS